MVKLVSMPVSAPLYPEPPYYYTKAEMVSILYSVDRKQVEDIVPAPLKLSKSPLVFAFVAWYPETTIGLYFEAATLIQARLKPENGEKIEALYCNSMFVDSDHALGAGREIWGYPKKLADMSIKKDGKKITGLLRRKNIDVMKITIDDPQTPLKEFPNANTLTMKQMMKGDGSGLEIQKLIATDFKVNPIEMKAGSATIEFGKSDDDPLYHLEPKVVMQGVYGISNLVLPYGRIVWSGLT